MSDEVISAEKGKFKVFVDGKDTLYDLTIRPDNIALGMIVPKDGQHVEIVGTMVIPEFSSLVFLTLGVSILGLVYFVRKSSFNEYFTGIR